MIKELDLQAWLRSKDACTAALDWVQETAESGASAEDLWAACPRGGWPLWVALRAGVPSRVVINAGLTVVEDTVARMEIVDAGITNALRLVDRWLLSESLDAPAALIEAHDALAPPPAPAPKRAEKSEALILRRARGLAEGVVAMVLWHRGDPQWCPQHGADLSNWIAGEAAELRAWPRPSTWEAAHSAVAGCVRRMVPWGVVKQAVLTDAGLPREDLPLTWAGLHDGSVFVDRRNGLFATNAHTGHLWRSVPAGSDLVEVEDFLKRRYAEFTAVR